MKGLWSARSVAGERPTVEQETGGRLRYDPPCGGDSNGVVREPAHRSRGDGSCAGAAGHALALEADGCRNAYRTCQSVDLHMVTRSLENPMHTVISMLWTGDGAGLPLRTSRTEAFNYHAHVSHRTIAVSIRASRYAPPLESVLFRYPHEMALP